MKITSDNNNMLIQKEIGLRIKRGRIDMNISQVDFAKRADISAHTLSVVENGGDVRLSNLIRILRVMGNLENFNLLLPELSLNPEDYRVLGKERQRVSSKNKTEINSTWKWGDEL